MQHSNDESYSDCVIPPQARSKQCQIGPAIAKLSSGYLGAG